MTAITSSLIDYWLNVQYPGHLEQWALPNSIRFFSCCCCCWDQVGSKSSTWYSCFMILGESKIRSYLNCLSKSSRIERSISIISPWLVILDHNISDFADRYCKYFKREMKSPTWKQRKQGRLRVKGKQWNEVVGNTFTSPWDTREVHGTHGRYTRHTRRN